ncbi:tRNA pseudouridine(55) synthase TruB [bacterium]|nr:tRNA pseudouridine(55) synthase TruB [bacterium]
MFGFLNVNKPSGITSHKVISILRKITGIKQIGHAGTLDPLASGVLPVAIGKASKLIDYLPSDKSYRVGMYLGMTSDTFDTEGVVLKRNCEKVTIEQIEGALSKFRGETKQVPPAFSAVHYNGKRLYELARSGKIPDDIPSRDITIYKNDIVDFDYEKQVLRLDISCSKGTYIRTIVNDLGEVLGCGAVMFELTRTEAASMKLKNAIELKETLSKNEIIDNLVKPQEVLPLTKIEISPDDFKRVLNGNKFENTYKVSNEILLLKEGKIIALAFADEKFIQPKKVLL